MAHLQRLRPIDTPTMHEEVQGRLKEYILANRLKAGDPLPTEAQFAEQLGVSRAAVREGLRSLESLGLIYSRRGEGRYVRGFNLDPIMENLQYSLLFDAEDLREMIEVRARLEAGFIGDAIAAMDAQTLADLHALVETMRRRAEAGEHFLDKDLEFHATIYRPIQNQVLSKLLNIFCVIYSNLRDQALLVAQVPTIEAGIHIGILEAIEAGDTERARRLIVGHFDGIKGRINLALNQSDNGQV